MFNKIVKVIGFTILALIIISTATIIWLDKKTDACWNQEADDVFKKYSSLTQRADILKLAGLTRAKMQSPVEVIEKDPNGCSVGGNGQTVVHFHFSKDDKLAKIEVYRNFIGSDQKMILVKQQSY